MPTPTQRAAALGVAADVLVVVLARSVPLPWAFLPVAVPLACAGGLLGGLVAGGTAPSTAVGRRLGGLVGALGGLVAAATLWAGMALVVALPNRTALWGLAYAFATSGVVTVTTAPAVGEVLSVLFALALAVLYAVEGVVGATLAVLWRERRAAGQ